MSVSERGPSTESVAQPYLSELSVTLLGDTITSFIVSLYFKVVAHALFIPLQVFEQHDESSERYY